MEVGPPGDWIVEYRFRSGKARMLNGYKQRFAVRCKFRPAQLGPVWDLIEMLGECTLRTVHFAYPHTIINTVRGAVSGDP